MLLSLKEEDRANPLLRYHLGMAYAMLGEAELARETLREALKGGEDFPGREEAERVVKEL